MKASANLCPPAHPQLDEAQTRVLLSRCWADAARGLARPTRAAACGRSRSRITQPLKWSYARRASSHGRSAGPGPSPGAHVERRPHRDAHLVGASGRRDGLQDQEAGAPAVRGLLDPGCAAALLRGRGTTEPATGALAVPGRDANHRHLFVPDIGCTGRPDRIRRANAPLCQRRPVQRTPRTTDPGPHRTRRACRSAGAVPPSIQPGGRRIRNPEGSTRRGSGGTGRRSAALLAIRPGEPAQLDRSQRGCTDAEMEATPGAGPRASMPRRPSPRQRRPAGRRRGRLRLHRVRPGVELDRRHRRHRICGDGPGRSRAP